MRTRPTIYNPAEEPKEQLVDKFVIRTEELQKILGPLKEADPTTPPQHYLIAGQRGMGKTTLLLRVKYAIEDDPLLNEWLIPVRFPEEQYNIGRLERLWEETAQLLENKNPLFAGLYNEMQTHEDSDDYEEKCLELLTDRLKQNNKRVVLLIDNIGELFDKFLDTEAHRLREVLMTNAQIQIIGGSSRILEHTFRYEKPFFEFFNQVKLEPLSQEESRELLQTLGKTYNKENVIATILTKQPERIEVMRRLTGGVPRTVVLLFEIFVDHESGSAFEDLQSLLDSVNSLYKHRMDELKPQQQQIVDALAKAWEPISAAEVLNKSKLYRDGMQSNQISSQLGQLEENQVVESVAGRGKKKTYRVRERFFNIWYLMRHGKKQSREEVLWLVRFLESWCTAKELLEMANSQVEAMRKGEYSVSGAYMKTMALHCIDSIDGKTKKELLDGTEKYLHEKERHDWAETISKLNEHELATLINKGLNSWEKGEFAESEKYFITAAESNKPIALIALGNFYYACLKNYDKAEKYYKLAIEDSDALYNLALVYDAKEDLIMAKSYYILAAEQDHVEAMYNLALLYEDEHDADNAEKYYKMAVDNGSIDAMFNIGYFYTHTKQDIEQAEKFYKMAADLGDSHASFNLALLYAEDMGDFLSAEKYYLKTVEANSVEGINNLALLYEDKLNNNEEAEKYYLLGLDRFPLNAKLLYNYILLLFDNNQIQKSIKYCAKLFSTEEIYANFDKLMTILNSLIKLAQYHFLLQQFQKPDSLLMKHAKPYYYAVAYFLKDEMPGEYEKAGSEIKETVDEIIQSVLPKEEKKIKSKKKK